MRDWKSEILVDPTCAVHVHLGRSRFSNIRDRKIADPVHRSGLDREWCLKSGDFLKDPYQEPVQTTVRGDVCQPLEHAFCSH